METFQIKNILNKKFGTVFKGAYARDQFSSLNTCVSAYYVVNTKPIASPGEHWGTIYVPRNRTDVNFDSFGFPPDHMDVIRFLQVYTTK